MPSALQAAEIRAIVARMGLTQAQTAALLGITPQHFRKILAGHPIATQTERLLLLLDRHGIPPEWHPSPATRA